MSIMLEKEIKDLEEQINLLKKKIDTLKLRQKGAVIIEASGEIAFDTIVVESGDFKAKAADIWENPTNYYDCVPGEDAYYNFLKYLWIYYPDDSEEQLAGYIRRECDFS